jgi:hypothetical protein
MVGWRRRGMGRPVVDKLEIAMIAMEVVSAFSSVLAYVPAWS